MKIIIEKANNGYIIKNYSEDYGEVTTVFSEDPDRKCDALYRLLWCLVELLEDTSSRYDEHRVMISCHPGDKVENPRYVTCPNQHWIVEEWLERMEPCTSGETMSTGKASIERPSLSVTISEDGGESE